MPEALLAGTRLFALTCVVAAVVILIAFSHPLLFLRYEGGPVKLGVDLAVAAATITLAFFTLKLFQRTATLAERTATLAEEAETSRTQANTHHEQRVSGILVIKNLKSRFIPSEDSGLPESYSESAPSELPVKYYDLRLGGEISNVGSGTNFKATLTCDEYRSKGNEFFRDVEIDTTYAPKDSFKFHVIYTNLQKNSLFERERYYFVLELLLRSETIFKATQQTSYLLEIREDESEKVQEYVLIPGTARVS